jgi:cytochrome c-type biogenesis protein CcmH/NrfF
MTGKRLLWGVPLLLALMAGAAWKFWARRAVRGPVVL